jgi:hypothetical protein
MLVVPSGAQEAGRRDRGQAWRKWGRRQGRLQSARLRPGRAVGTRSSSLLDTTACGGRRQAEPDLGSAPAETETARRLIARQALQISENVVDLLAREVEVRHRRVRISEPAPDLVGTPLLASKQGRQRRAGISARPFGLHHVAAKRSQGAGSHRRSGISADIKGDLRETRLPCAQDRPRTKMEGRRSISATA